MIQPINRFMRLDRTKSGDDSNLPEVIYVWGRFVEICDYDEYKRYALYQPAVLIGNGGRVIGEPTITEIECLDNFYDQL